MALMLSVLLAMQACQGGADVADEGTSASSDFDSAESSGDTVLFGAFVADNVPELLTSPKYPNATVVTEFFKNMSGAKDTFNRISYHHSSGVVLRGKFNNAVSRAIFKSLPTAMTAGFSHHWLEFGVSNRNLSARTIVNKTYLQAVELHFMDSGFQWKFGAGHAAETEVASSEQVIDPKRVIALVQDHRPWKAFTHNCQDVTFEQWKMFVTDPNTIQPPVVTKIKAVAADGSVLVAIIMLVCCYRKKWLQQHHQILSQPLLQN